MRTYPGAYLEISAATLESKVVPSAANAAFPPLGSPGDTPVELPSGVCMGVFRIVRHDDPGRSEYPDSFKSHLELGLPPRGTELANPQIYEGISVYERLESAIETARRWPKIGTFVARMELVGGSGVRLLRWGPEGHLTVWGDALMLSGMTAEIVAVQAP